jgi:hypothetical protein
MEAQRAHVMQAVGELDEDDPDVVGHGQEHLADVLGLPLLGAGGGHVAQLGHAGDDVRHVRAEKLQEVLRCRAGVFENVVQDAGGDTDDVQPHVGQNVGHLEGVHEVGLAGQAYLPCVSPAE